MTPNQRVALGVGWSLNLTSEVGYITALIVGLLIGNFLPSGVSFLHEAIRPELYIKVAIVILGGFLGVTAAEQLGLATSVMFRSLCAIVEAYLIYWALVYWVARKYFKFSREWAVPLASGISICGVSAAIATGAAIRARPIVPIMVSSLVVIFSVIGLLFLPFLAQTFLYREPMVAGAWMGLVVKTDGAAVASGAITESLILAKAQPRRASSTGKAGWWQSLPPSRSSSTFLSAYGPSCWPGSGRPRSKVGVERRSVRGFCGNDFRNSSSGTWQPS